MVNKFEDAIKISLKAYAQRRAALPRLISNAAVNHFKDGFRKQGWDDNVVTAWKKRKGNKDPGRSILVKSGRLRRSFTSVVAHNRITVTNDAPYAHIHNEGGSFDGGSRTLSFKRVDKLVTIRGKKTVKMGLELTKSGSKRTVAQQKVTLGQINMPKRKFMGESENLNEKNGQIISKTIKSALR